jgi:hypothetical protein
LTAQVLDGDGDLARVAREHLPRLTWETVGGAAYAVARHRNSLVLFARLGEDLKPLTIRLGDGEQAVDASGLAAVFNATSPVFNGGGRWVVDGAQRLSAEGEPPVLVLRLLPAADRQPGAALSLRAECGGAVDAPVAPWWLRRTWRPVTGGP